MSEEIKYKVAEACAWFDALSPEQKIEHRRVQRKSYVIGELMLSHPELPREEAEKIYEMVAL